MKMVLVGHLRGAVGDSERELQSLSKEFSEILRVRGLQTENLKVDGTNGDVSFNVPDHLEQDSAIQQALLTYARDLEHTSKYKVEILVSVPQLNFEYLVVSDELGLG